MDNQDPAEHCSKTQGLRGWFVCRSDAFAVVGKHPWDAEGAEYYYLRTDFAAPLWVRQGTGTLGYQTIVTKAQALPPSHAPVVSAANPFSGFRKKTVVRAQFRLSKWNSQQCALAAKTAATSWEPHRTCKDESAKDCKASSRQRKNRTKLWQQGTICFMDLHPGRLQVC